MFLRILVISVLIALAVPAAAQIRSYDMLYEEGLAAYEAGDYRTALRLWLRTVYLGDPDAAFAIAVLYEYGLGVAPDLNAALEWYRYAADHGSPEAIRRLQEGPDPG